MRKCPLWSLNPHLRASSKALLTTQEIKSTTKSLSHSGSKIGTSGTDINWNWQINSCIVWCSYLFGRRSLTCCMHAHMVEVFAAVLLAMYVHRPCGLIFFACFDIQRIEKVCLCQQCQIEWFAHISSDYQDLENWFTYLCSYWRSSSPHRVPSRVLTHATLQLSALNWIPARVSMDW